MVSNRKRTVIVARRAQGMPTADTSEVVDQARPHATEGAAVIKLLYASVDPGMRGWVVSE